MAKLNGNLSGWLRTIIIVLSCCGTLAYGWGVMGGNVRLVEQRTVALEAAFQRQETRHRTLSEGIREQLRALERQTTRNSTKLDLLLRKDKP